MAETFVGVRFTQLCGYSDFWAQTFHKL